MMKKAFGQTVRDLKRGVNKKVLKVPSIEQKVLDATSNEPWGPHGSSLAEIAQATRNYHEYQIIMSIIWKRINDTGKNWRHVYKALTVLDYLIANGSERVIDEIREHAYQISTLSDFQYIDSSGRDQGSNVRKKSQSLVVLVNDRERIEEVREKAAANREKYRSTSMGGIYKPGSHPRTEGYGERYDDEHYEGRYGGRDVERNGYGPERDWGSRDDDKYGGYGDSNSRDGDRYGRDYEGHYGRDCYVDDDSRGRSSSVEDYNHGPRSRSSDRDRDRSYEDDDQYTSRGTVGKADGSRDGRRHDEKYSEQEPAVPPSYEEAVGEADSPAHSERNGETAAPKSSSPLSTSHQESTTTNPPATPTAAPHPASEEKEFESFDVFDPRGSFTAAPPSSNGAEVDLFGSLSDPYNLNSLAVVPTATAAATTGAGAFTDSGSGNGFFSNSSASNQPFEDPFGDGPFKAISSTESFPDQQQNVTTSSFQPSSNQSEPHQPAFEDTKFDFGETDILADILPPSGSSPNGFSALSVHSVSQTGSETQTEAFETSFEGKIDQPATLTGFQSLPDQSSSQTTFPVTQLSSMSGYAEQVGQPSQQAGFHHGGQYSSFTGFQSQASISQPAGFSSHSQPSQAGHNYNVNFNQQPGSTESMTPRYSSGPPGLYSHMNPISQSSPHIAPQMQQAGSSALPTSASTDSLAIVPQPAKDKFETKSMIWKDTLNRGLVNLNISGSKTNPLANIGVDFDAINRKEKRMEKPSQTPVMSTVTMGRAMGSGTGIGRAGASALRAGPNPMTASGMHIGMAGVPGAGIGMAGVPGAGIGMAGARGAGMCLGPGPVMGMGMPMGGGYGVNQPMGGMGIGMGMNQPMGPGMNVGVGQGVPMQQQPIGFAQVPSMPGGFNPMMGMGNYSQQPYNGSYR